MTYDVEEEQRFLKVWVLIGVLDDLGLDDMTSNFHLDAR